MTLQQVGVGALSFFFSPCAFPWMVIELLWSYCANKRCSLTSILEYTTVYVAVQCFLFYNIMLPFLVILPDLLVLLLGPSVLSLCSCTIFHGSCKRAPNTGLNHGFLVGLWRCPVAEDWGVQNLQSQWKAASKCSLGLSCLLVCAKPWQDWTEGREMFSLSLYCLLQPMGLTETLSQLLPQEKLLEGGNPSFLRPPPPGKRDPIPVAWNCSERCWSSSPLVAQTFLHISLLLLSSSGFLSHSHRLDLCYSMVWKSIPLKEGGWCFHLPGNGERSWWW